ncbi:MAG TPA: murein biosynthesis integral membrane protein MurJ [Chloroflexota bacterium]|nr:murein biosynthesis integral membrane protein MurJ [Chloroflexota bacterium]
MVTAQARRLAGAAAIVMVAYVASRLTGLLRDIAISYRFGTSPEYGAYVAAMQVPDLVFQVVAGAAVASAFIPVYSRYLADKDPEEGWQLVNSLFSIAVVILVPLILLVMVFTPQIMRILVSDFTPEYQQLAASLARVVLFAPLFFTIGSFSTSLLNAHQRFFLAAVAPSCYNLGIILGAVVLSRWFGIYGLALGALGGSFCFLVVQLPGLRIVGFKFRPRLDFRHPGVIAVAKLMGPRTLGLAVTQLNFLVAIYLSSGIVGGVPALRYAWTLTMLPLGVFAMAIGTAVFPSLAEQNATAAFEEMRQTLLNSLRFILYLTIPASIGLIVLSSSVVRLIYQRGEFDAASTALVSGALQFYAAGLLGMATIEILARAFYAMHDTWTPVKTGTLGMAINLILGVTLVRFMGLNGLALATAIASTVEATALFSVGHRRLQGLQVRPLFASAALSFVGSLAMAAAVMAITAIDSPLQHVLGGLPHVAGAIVVGGAVYLFMTTALGSPEVGQLRRVVRRRFG